MTHLDAELVGVLVGSIMPHSKALVFYLYRDADNRRHARIAKSPAFDNPTDEMHCQAEAFSNVVRNVWRNESSPCWWYLQLADSPSPAQLNIFALPWTVYKNWRTVEGGEG